MPPGNPADCLWASVKEGEEQLTFFFPLKTKRIVLVQTQNGMESFFT